jgi:hypothetical protein
VSKHKKGQSVPKAAASSAVDSSIQTGWSADNNDDSDDDEGSFPRSDQSVPVDSGIGPDLSADNNDDSDDGNETPPASAYALAPGWGANPWKKVRVRKQINEKKQSLELQLLEVSPWKYIITKLHPLLQDAEQCYANGEYSDEDNEKTMNFPLMPTVKDDENFASVIPSWGPRPLCVFVGRCPCHCLSNDSRISR